jgi:2-polyprenyl-3-methyl-5-hydroxy-6-metoxy-1,4-benzoquinol methylase
MQEVWLRLSRPAELAGRNAMTEQRERAQLRVTDEYSRSFWDRTFDSIRQSHDITAKDFGGYVSPQDREFWRLVGDIRGLDILEIGCGIGNDTVQYLEKGAHLTSVDLSSVAVDCACQRISALGLSADVRAMNAFEVGSLGKQFDLIVGKLVLHHLEPFTEIGALFSSCLKPGGRIIFLENNSRNPLLMFARNNLAGRFGIPRYGDEVEHPFTPEEVASLRQFFGEVRCYFPSFIFFRKINTYVFRQKPFFRPIMRTFDWVDDTLWRVFPGVRKFSYQQIVTATAPKLSGAREKLHPMVFSASSSSLTQ